MSNFSSIGFAVHTEEEFRELVEFCFEKGQKIRSHGGTYFVYSDKSGAALYGQLNPQNEIIGINPHFAGKSKRRVCLTATYARPESELDGAFHCWADPEHENDPDSGAYPFVFDAPDFNTIGEIRYPKDFSIQLAAFAREIELYDDEPAFEEQQHGIGEGASEVGFAAQSFIPTGLFSEEENSTPEATGLFAGIIKEWELRSNEHTGATFYWLLVETLGCEVDVVFDPIFTDKEPRVGGVVQGTFWLSGKLIDPPFQGAIAETKKSFWKKLFG
ncbi:MAG: hypothetical protein EOO11_05325 [Chitinophagaceae bacterium]|nr:MAG: hypothetical protein EOO11_05325 [Chitinophagaceae bacterium]